MARLKNAPFFSLNNWLIKFCSEHVICFQARQTVLVRHPIDELMDTQIYEIFLLVRYKVRDRDEWFVKGYMAK